MPPMISGSAPQASSPPLSAHCEAIGPRPKILESIRMRDSPVVAFLLLPGLKRSASFAAATRHWAETESASHRLYFESGSAARLLALFRATACERFICFQAGKTKGASVVSP
jgi:hypothetical protein